MRFIHRLYRTDTSNHPDTRTDGHPYRGVSVSVRRGSPPDVAGQCPVCPFVRVREAMADSLFTRHRRLHTIARETMGCPRSNDNGRHAQARVA